jgi:hypothetical protein
VLAALTIASAAWPAAAISSTAVGITNDTSSVDRRLGQDFSFTSTVHNSEPTSELGLVVHLNVLSLDHSVYVDPEDWSSNRTRYISVPAGGAVDVRWTLKAVNGGNFIVYIAALGGDGSGPIAVSQPIRVHVSERRSLNPGGVLPFVIAIPAALSALATGRWIKRKRGRAVA